MARGHPRTRTELCLDAVNPMCGFPPGDVPDPTRPISFPDNFPGEAFHMLAGSDVQIPVGRPLLAGLVTMPVVALPVSWWIGRVTEQHAVDHVLRTSQRLRSYAVAPRITEGLLSGGVADTAPPDRRLQPCLQDGTIHRLTFWDAAELERVRVVRDLHDDVVQDLAGLSYALEAQEMNAAPEQRSTLGRSRTILLGSLRTLCGITTALYSPDLMTLGLSKAMVRLTDPLVQRGVDTSVQIGPAVFLAPEQEGMFLKVAREALANISKHAHASTVTLHLDAEHGATAMTISDDGTGFDDFCGSPQGHLGLRIMRDIADAAGAELVLRSRPGAGTTAVTTLPHDALTVRF